MSSPAYVPSPDDRFPDCYPRNPKPCAAHGVAFFACLNKNSEKLNSEDTEASARALKACLAEKKIYENCVGKYEAENPPKRFRVQDEYRKLSKP